jgi:hypothetical protein
LEHLPLRVVLNLTDSNFQSQAQILRDQVQAAGGTFISHDNLSAVEFLDQVAGYLNDGPVAVVDQGFVTGQGICLGVMEREKVLPSGAQPPYPRWVNPTPIHLQLRCMVTAKE